MTTKIAKDICGKNLVGPDELASLPWLSGEKIAVPKIPFSESVLKTNADSHILILTPSLPHITINWFRETFGVDPSREPCMYNQDWYLKEDFASTISLDGEWHLIQKKVREDVRAQRPDEIEAKLAHERFPTAVMYAFTFFAWWALTEGERLWKHDFLWCSDRDHNGDRIYVGRYEDPSGVNKNGFNIHRHLTLRSAYSAAPEVSA